MNLSGLAGTRAVVGALALLLAGCAGPACQLHLAANLPMAVLDGHFVVDTKINGVHAVLMLDTGAAVSVLTPDIVKTAKVFTEITPWLHLSGVGGERQAKIARPLTMDFGGARGQELTIVEASVDMTLRGQNGEPQKIDGVLGMDLLGGYDIDLDTVGHRALLYSAGEGCSKTTVVLAGNLYPVPLLPAVDSDDHSVRVRLTIDGKPFRSVIDSGVQDLTIYRNAAAAAGLGFDESQAVVGDWTTGVGKRRVAFMSRRLNDVAIGDLTLANLPADVIDQGGDGGEDMLLGEGFIRKVHLWISN